MKTTGKLREKLRNAAIVLGLLFVFSASARANISVTPTAIKFPGQTVGTISAPTKVTITNNSKAGIKIVSGSVSAPQFAFSGPSLPITLSRGQSATWSVTFDPSAAQSYSGTLQFTRMNSATISVSLSGAGTQTPIPSASPLPPSITSQPASKAVNAGQTATFSVAATGSTPMGYQWSKNGMAISGATLSSYTTPATTTSDNGEQFAVTLSNGAGTATSNSATLAVTSVLTPYVIRTINPLSITATVGTNPAAQSIVMSDTAPTDPTYSLSSNQTWLTATVSTVNTGSGYVIPVKVNSSGLAAGTYQGNITITIPNQNGMTWTNSPYPVPVTLIVTASTAVAPKITTQPAGQSIAAGQTATFNVATTGTAPMSYQWNKNGTSIGGATSSSYTTPSETTADNNAQFSVVVTNSAGTATSNAATLTVGAATAILNSSASTVNFGSTSVSSTSTQSVTLTNAGNSAVTISNVSVSGAGFYATNVSTGTILNPGQAVTLTASFTPVSAASVTGSVTVASNASNSPDMIALSGTGVIHSVSLSWSPSVSTVIGYNSYSSNTSGGPYTKLTSTPVPTTGYTDSNVQAGQTLFFVVTSVDSNSVESAFSTEVAATVP